MQYNASPKDLMDRSMNEPAEDEDIRKAREALEEVFVGYIVLCSLSFFHWVAIYITSLLFYELASLCFYLSFCIYLSI